jgi:hypothetical protein
MDNNIYLHRYRSYPKVRLRSMTSAFSIKGNHHRLNMETDLQSTQLYSLAETAQLPPSPAFGLIEEGAIGQPPGNHITTNESTLGKGDSPCVESWPVPDEFREQCRVSALDLQPSLLVDFNNGRLGNLLRPTETLYKLDRK